MKIAIAQINCTVGDLSGNCAKIASYAQKAKKRGARLLVTPELALCGYPPEDLLLRKGFLHACTQALANLAAETEGIAVLVGHPCLKEGKLYNAASLVRNGKVAGTYFKHKLPNYTVFDEKRYFESGDTTFVFDMEGVNFGVAICEDIWMEGVAEETKEADVLLVLNASPYHVEKQFSRYQAIQERIAGTGLSIVYANLVGGQDELVFDGASFVISGNGELTHQLPFFEECLEIIELENNSPLAGKIEKIPPLEANVYKALCLGVKDYVGKNNFPGVLLGLSGGVDSALTLAVAVDALGAEKVHAVMMPSGYTADISVEDSREMAQNFGVKYSEISIQPLYGLFLETLEKEFAGLPRNTAEENIQARIRGTILMGLSNKNGSIVLTTGNKSEMAVGYCTLYGDMAGGFSVLKDIKKTLVYRLCHYRNSVGKVIPFRVMERPPSAELKEDQHDQDSLPPYEVLDLVMEAYMEQDISLPNIVALGIREEDARRVIHLIRINEYKRRQSPVGIRVTARGFGRDWRYPITSKFLDEF